MLIEAKNLTKEYQMGHRRFSALKGIDLTLYEGETVALIGESGSGKSTLGKLLLQLETPTSGSITYHPSPFSRKEMQIIFQDPYGSLNPKMRISDIVAEGLDIHGIPRGKLVEELLVKVGLDPRLTSRYPKQLSGGQRQRVSIARALALNPRFIVCDEPLAALDMANQRKVLDLFLELKRSLHLTYLFITHDLTVLPHIADRVVVMKQGEIVEVADTPTFFTQPQHPYSKQLLASRLPRASYKNT